MRTRRTSIPLFLVATLAVTACATDPAPFRAAAPTVAPSGGTPSADPDGETGSTRSQIYAAVIRQLLTVDHTFGGAGSPFDRVFVVDGTVPQTGQPPWPLTGAEERFPDQMKASIASQLEDLPPLEWVADPDGLLVGPPPTAVVRDEGAIITLGPISDAQGGVHVRSGIWCGGSCGQWLTYVLSKDDGRWRVTGKTGTIAVA